MKPHEVIKAYRDDIILFAKHELGLTPDDWQGDALRCYAGQAPTDKIIMKACVGPGKSCTMSTAFLWFLMTQGEKGLHPKGACLSITRDNLRDGLWAEVAKWRRQSQFFSHRFEQTREKFFAIDHPETWFISARSFARSATAEMMAAVLSGIHSDYISFFIDECGSMNPVIAKAAKQALSRETIKFGRIVGAGNPLDRQSLLGTVCYKEADDWHIITISNDPEDPKRSARVSIEWARKQISLYGRDDPWVQAHVLSQFPLTGINTLLTEEDVLAAQRRSYTADHIAHAQKRLGVDVAGSGLDLNVIFPRQGLVAFNYSSQRNLRPHELAAKIAHSMDAWSCDNVVVDSTGGWGESTVHALETSGLRPTGVNFGSKSPDKRYHNMRSYMWWKMAEWIKKGGMLPNDDRLMRELTSVQYALKDGKFILERKEQVKERLGWSPDVADALALTFALPDQIAQSYAPTDGSEGYSRDWNPLKSPV